MCVCVSLCVCVHITFESHRYFEGIALDVLTAVRPGRHCAEVLGSRSLEISLERFAPASYRASLRERFFCC